MPSRWATFPIELKGGLDTEAVELTQGISMPGSARRLVNLEPALTGGYERVRGYTKYDENVVPYYGAPRVQGGSQTGTSLVVTCLDIAPDDGDTFSIDGVTGTYTISSSSYTSSSRQATLTITPALASSPADAAAITFLSGSTTIQGLHIFEDSSVVARRAGSVWKSAGSGWTLVSVPDHGTVLVDGGAQTGTSLVVKGIDADSKPQPGDTFTIAGVALTYTVISCGTITAGVATMVISRALDSSPADEAAITWVTSGISYSSSAIQRGYTYRFSTTTRTVFVDGLSMPYSIDQSTNKLHWFVDAPAEVIGATDVAVFRNTIFFSKLGILSYMVVGSDSDFTVGLGAGSINPGASITRLKPFKDYLVVFGETKVKALGGNSTASYVLQSISETVGCLHPDSIQEIGGDLLFLAPEGIRFLSDSDRFGEFALNLASKNIRNDMRTFATEHPRFCSVNVQSKNQYRVFGYSVSQTTSSSKGYLATQFGAQSENQLSWCELKGFKVNIAASDYYGNDEIVVFANNADYVYQMENGNNLDGDDVEFSYWGPQLSISDPTIRKTFHTFKLYGSFQSVVDVDLNLVLDFNVPNTIQPSTIILSTQSSTPSVWGSAVWGTDLWGTQPTFILYSQTVGAGNTVSYRLSGTHNLEPFRIDTIVLEFMEHGRK